MGPPVNPLTAQRQIFDAGVLLCARIAWSETVARREAHRARRGSRPLRQRCSGNQRLATIVAHFLLNNLRGNDAAYGGGVLPGVPHLPGIHPYGACVPRVRSLVSVGIAPAAPEVNKRWKASGGNAPASRQSSGTERTNAFSITGSHDRQHPSG